MVNRYDTAASMMRLRLRLAVKRMDDMNTDYSEDALIEQPTIELFSELEYETASCFYEKVGTSGSTLGRETTAEVILIPKLRTALQKLNPDLPSDAINLAIETLTGTPLMAGEEKTREVFGDYVSIYNFQQSIEDGATVPLFYENRIPELQLANDSFKEDLEALIDAAELDADQQKKLEREFAREYHLITRDDRMEKAAEDIVAHFMGRKQSGKGIVICIDKLTAVRMYDKVLKYWKAYLGGLKAQSAAMPVPIRSDVTVLGVTEGFSLAAEDVAEFSVGKRRELQSQIEFMENTDMAVIVSQQQNEVDVFQEKGLNIGPHRLRMVNEDMETKFKDADDPFRLVFVCAMWLTGFDAPAVSTIYLDKPMKNHTLMQTIDRANRVFKDKNSGLIVDYVGVFRNLQKALATRLQCRDGIAVLTEIGFRISM